MFNEGEPVKLSAVERLISVISDDATVSIPAVKEAHDQAVKQHQERLRRETAIKRQIEQLRAKIAQLEAQLTEQQERLSSTMGESDDLSAAEPAVSPLGENTVRNTVFIALVQLLDGAIREGMTLDPTDEYGYSPAIRNQVILPALKGELGDDWYEVLGRVPGGCGPDTPRILCIQNLDVYLIDEQGMYVDKPTELYKSEFDKMVAELTGDQVTQIIKACATKKGVQF